MGQQFQDQGSLEAPVASIPSTPKGEVEEDTQQDTPASA